MTDADIRAFGPHPAPPPTGRGAHLWRWLLAAALVLFVLAVWVGGVAWIALTEAAREGINITVNGEPWATADFGGQHVVFGMLAVLVVLVTVLLVVPLSLLLALLAAGLGIGVGLLAVLAVAAVVLSPLWLILLLLWLLLRRKPAAATMGP